MLIYQTCLQIEELDTCSNDFSTTILATIIGGTVSLIISLIVAFTTKAIDNKNKKRQSYIKVKEEFFWEYYKLLSEYLVEPIKKGHTVSTLIENFRLKINYKLELNLETFVANEWESFKRSLDLIKQCYIKKDTKTIDEYIAKNKFGSNEDEKTDQFMFALIMSVKKHAKEVRKKLLKEE